MEGAEVFNETLRGVVYTSDGDNISIVAVIIPIVVVIIGAIAALGCCCRMEKKIAQREAELREMEKAESPAHLSGRGTIPQTGSPASGQVNEMRSLDDGLTQQRSSHVGPEAVSQMQIPAEPEPVTEHDVGLLIMSDPDPPPTSARVPASETTFATQNSPPEPFVPTYSAPAPSVAEETREYREDPEDGQHYDIQSFYEAYGAEDGQRRWDMSEASARHIPLSDLQGVL